MQAALVFLSGVKKNSSCNILYTETIFVEDKLSSDGRHKGSYTQQTSNSLWQQSFSQAERAFLG
jgi:hypothetical protein